jgi:hypothetical protein
MPQVGCHAPRRDDQPPTGGHGITRVHRKIEKRHFDLIGIGKREGQFIGDLHLDFDFRSARRGHQIAHPGDERRDVYRLGLQRLPPGKGKKTLHQHASAIGGLQGAVDQTLFAWPANLAS